MNNSEKKYWVGRRKGENVIPMNENYCSKSIPLSNIEKRIFSEGETLYVWNNNGISTITRQKPPKDYKEIMRVN